MAASRFGLHAQLGSLGAALRKQCSVNARKHCSGASTFFWRVWFLGPYTARLLWAAARIVSNLSWRAWSTGLDSRGMFDVLSSVLLLGSTAFVAVSRQQAGDFTHGRLTPGTAGMVL